MGNIEGLKRLFPKPVRLLKKDAKMPSPFSFILDTRKRKKFICADLKRNIPPDTHLRMNNGAEEVAFRVDFFNQ